MVGEWSNDQFVGLVQDLYKLTAGNADFLHAQLLASASDDEGLAPFKERTRKAVSPREPWKQNVRLSEDDRDLASEFLPMLVRKFERIDGQIGWGYPDELGDHIAELREHFDS